MPKRSTEGVTLVKRCQHARLSTRRKVIRAAEGIGGRVKFLTLAWVGMPKTSFRKNNDSLMNARADQRLAFPSLGLPVLG